MTGKGGGGLPKGKAEGKRLKGKRGRDGLVMRGFMALIALDLVVALAFPLYAMLSKSFSTFRFDLTAFEFQVSDEDGRFTLPPVSAAALNDDLQAVPPEDLATSGDGRLPATSFFPDFSFRSPLHYRIRGTTDDAVYLIGSERFSGTGWQEVDSNTFRRVMLRPVRDIGLTNYATYFSTPSLFRSIEN